MKKKPYLDPDIREQALSDLQGLFRLDDYPVFLTKEQRHRVVEAITGLIGIGIADGFLKVRASLYHSREQYENLLPLEIELNEQNFVAFYIRQKPNSKNLICFDIGHKLSWKNFRKKKI
jgi:hypothetical protein